MFSLPFHPFLYYFLNEEEEEEEEIKRKRKHENISLLIANIKVQANFPFASRPIQAFICIFFLFVQLVQRYTEYMVKPKPKQQKKKKAKTLFH